MLIFNLYIIYNGYSCSTGAKSCLILSCKNKREGVERKISRVVHKIDIVRETASERDESKEEEYEGGGRGRKRRRREG